MKKSVFSILIAASLLLTGCGKEQHTETSDMLTESGSLMLAVTSPAEETTVPATDPVETLSSETYIAESTSAPAETAAPAETVLPPVISKSPTGETVTEGGKAIFIGHADNADSVCWWFVPGGQGPMITAEEMAVTLPPIAIEGGTDDTLILSGIPLQLDGWSVKAEFKNAAGSSYTDCAVISVMEGPIPADTSTGNDNSTGSADPVSWDVPAVYVPVLENIRLVKEEFRKTEFNPGPSDAVLQQDVFNIYYGIDLLWDDLGYALYDLDQDGQDELLIACLTDGSSYDADGNYTGIIFAMFGNQNGNPVKIFQSRVRDRYYICDGNLIRNEGSNGASNNTIEITALHGSSLELVECLRSEDYSGTGTVSFHYATTVQDRDNGTDLVTSEEYQNIYERIYQIPGAKLPAFKKIS